MIIRAYKSSDYNQVASLYKQSHLYGGQFDENRDSSEKLNKLIKADPEAILVAERRDKIIGTVSLIEDGRVAWLFRFAVMQGEDEVTLKLYEEATGILKAREHSQVIVYSPADNKELYKRYESLGFNKGDTYTAFWRDI